MLTPKWIKNKVINLALYKLRSQLIEDAKKAYVEGDMDIVAFIGACIRIIDDPNPEESFKETVTNHPDINCEGFGCLDILDMAYD